MVSLKHIFLYKRVEANLIDNTSVAANVEMRQSICISACAACTLERHCTDTKEHMPLIETMGKINTLHTQTILQTNSIIVAGRRINEEPTCTRALEIGYNLETVTKRENFSTQNEETRPIYRSSHFIAIITYNKSKIKAMVAIKIALFSLDRS